MSTDSSPSRSPSASPGDQILGEESESRPDGPNDDVAAVAISPASPEPPAQAASETENGTATAPIEIPVDNEAPETTASSASPNRDRATTTDSGGPSGQLPANMASRTRPRPPIQPMDRRIRNPVPPKLLNMANKKDGNFAVMHVDFFNRPLMDERDLAAKRSSEATQAAALNAAKDGYRPLKRSKHVWNPQPPGSPAGPPEPQYYAPPQHHGPPQHYAPPQHPYTPPPPPPYWQPRPEGPPPDEVKSEQARLLTFLRSLHPVLVVDQLCKALAYFGGIPGAPPPADHKGFPQSDRNNGSGALVVGWLSEIFPPADLPPSSKYPAGLGGTDAGQAGNAGSPGVIPGRRPRGRPKGSKSSKARKDKGIKKGPRAPLEGEEAGPDGTSTQPVLVDEGNNEVPESSDQPPEPSQAPEVQSSADGPSATHESQNPESPILSTPGSRRKGRPKGSKNRPKPPVVNLTQSQPGYNNAALETSPTLNIARTAGSNSTNRPPDSPYSSSPTAQRAVPTAEATLSLHAQNWTDPPPQSPRHSGDDSRKRPIEQTVPDNEITTQANQSQYQSQTRHQLPEGAQGAQGARNKRRRISDSQLSSTTRHLDSQSAGAELSAAPEISSSVAHNATPTPTSGSFGSQSPRNVAPTSRPNSGQMGRQSGAQFRPSPQQQFQQPQRHSPALNQGQQQQQNYYGQSQRQFASNQHQQHHVAAPATSSSSAGTSYPSFGENQYLNMQYALSSGRPAQQRNTASSFGPQAQLDAAMGEPRMQEHMFSPYRRR